MKRTYRFDNYSSRRELRHALKRAEPEIFEDVILFLEDDPRTFGSGYEKEMMWKYIKRYTLQATHLQRLEKAALKYIGRPMTPEYKHLCQTMSWIASDAFWQTVQTLLDSDNPVIALNASVLLPYSKGINIGEKERLTRKRLRRYSYQRRPTVTQAALMALMENETNWKGGTVVKGITTDPYINWHYYDESFTAIDWTLSIPEVLVPRLGQVLLNCHIEDTETEKTAAYIAYALGKIGDPSAVVILDDFLKLKVDYKFESIKKHIICTVVFKALERIGTPEALQAIADRSQLSLDDVLL